MKNIYIRIILPIVVLTMLFCFSCTKLDVPVYSSVDDKNFWQTPEQIAAGISPVYTQLVGLQGDPNFGMYSGVSTDEIVVPLRGGDWGGNYLSFYRHNWVPNDLNGLWGNLFSGIGKCNYILDKIGTIPDKVPEYDKVVAEIKIMRAFYYLQAIDNFGNVPIVTKFNTDPSAIKTNSRKEVFDFIESELKANIPFARTNVDASTYGRATKWLGLTVLAKLYLNAQVYTGTERWEDCAKACDEIITSGPYSLEPGYYDNFKPTNNWNNSKENIFVIPFDNKFIGGNLRENFNLHYGLGGNFGLTGPMWNGWGTHGDFYYGNYDTTSVYTKVQGKIYRTFKDQRTGQFLVGQQYVQSYPYPPDKNILYYSPLKADSLFDGDAPLYLQPNFDLLVLPEGKPGKLVGARNIKYFPEAGTSVNQSNDVVVYRLADILLMRAETIMRGAPIGSTGSAADLVNIVRMRAYNNDVSYKWSGADITPANLLAERARELAYEFFRRQDLIRFDVKDGTHYFDGQRGGVRSPLKAADPDTHLRLFPIPETQYLTNKNLVQNPGYPPFN